MNLRSHLIIVPFAVAMALLIELPLILFPILAGKDYQGINIAHFGTDQHFYLTRAREVLDGNGLGNSILREGKDGQDPFFTWNERVLLTPYRWLGVAESMNVATLYTVMNCVGIFILILLLYCFAYQLSNNKLISTTIATFVVGGYSFVFNRTIFYADMNLYGRAMSPYLSSIGLFIYLNLLVRMNVKFRLRTAIAAAFAFGALFYIYLYAWTYALAFNGILLALFLFRREWNRARSLAAVMVVGLLIGSYNLFFLFRSLFSDAGREIRYFHFVEHTHAPLFSIVGAVSLCIFAVYWWKNRKDERLPYIFAFILAGWAVLNQQIVTGLKIQPGHYYWYFVVPVGIILALFMVWSLLKRSWRPAFCAVLLLAVFVNTIGGQYRSTLRTVSDKLEEQRFQPILGELQKDREPSVVLTAGNENAYLFTIFTHHDLFWHGGATYFRPDKERIKDALSVFLLLNRAARNNVSEFLNRVANDPSSGDFYVHIFYSLEGFTSGYNYDEYQKMRDSKNPDLMAHREKLIGELSVRVEAMNNDPKLIKDLLGRYGVEYIAWDAKRYSNWDVSVIPGATEILTSNDIHLFKMVF